MKGSHDADQEEALSRDLAQKARSVAQAPAWTRRRPRVDLWVVLTGSRGKP